MCFTCTLKWRSWLLLWGSFFFSAALSAAETLTIETMYKIPLSTNDGQGLIDLITKERFSRIGLNVELQSVPSSLALEQANSGVYDGDIMRVPGASAKYPNLIQVPGVVYQFDFVAFTKNPDIKLDGWDSLKPYRVAVPQGWVETDAKVSEANTTTLERISTPAQLFSALFRDKVDLIVFERMMGYELMNTLDIKDIITVEPPLSSKEMFLYLHKKHEALVPQLETAMKSMISDGTVQKLNERFLAKYRETQK